MLSCSYVYGCPGSKQKSDCYLQAAWQQPLHLIIQGIFNSFEAGNYVGNISLEHNE